MGDALLYALGEFRCSLLRRVARRARTTALAEQHEDNDDCGNQKDNEFVDGLPRGVQGGAVWLATTAPRLPSGGAARRRSS